MKAIASARRLSEKKIAVSYDLKIRPFSTSEFPDSAIGAIQHTFVYRKIEDGTYYPVLKDGFIAKICGKWGIKKKYVIFNRCPTQQISIDGESVEFFALDCVFTDDEWVRRWRRDSSLNSILNNI